jgi:hypothetical protein
MDSGYQVKWWPLPILPIKRASNKLATRSKHFFSLLVITYFDNSFIFKSIIDDFVLEEVGDGAAAADEEGRQDLDVADPLLQVNNAVLVQA